MQPSLQRSGKLQIYCQSVCYPLLPCNVPFCERDPYGNNNNKNNNDDDYDDDDDNNIRMIGNNDDKMTMVKTKTTTTTTMMIPIILFPIISDLNLKFAKFRWSTEPTCTVMW